MTDFLRINRLKEEHFTEIVESAGGRRYSKDDSRELNLNADYILGNAILELKLIEEEGLDKGSRQRKLVQLFRDYDSSPVVVLDSDILSAQDKRKYLNILEGPIKTQVKKASKQLKITATNGEARILIIVNNGYQSLAMDEFKAVVNKCVRNDTTNIDYVICGGIYYYNDGFESWVIAPFQLEKINQDAESEEYIKLLDSWHLFLNRYMAEFARNEDRDKDSKLPVLDLEFQEEGRVYVKPAPPFGQESQIWKRGRPRINTSGMTQCPPIADTYPKLDRHAWNLVSEAIDDPFRLKESYEDWLGYWESQHKVNSNEIKPIVPIAIEECRLREALVDSVSTYEDLCDYANDVFETEVRKIIFAAREFLKAGVFLYRYILVVIKEIGRDKKNDLCSIYLVQSINENEEYNPLVENRRMFYEYGLALASAYALKLSTSCVLIKKDQTYAWS